MTKNEKNGARAYIYTRVSTVMQVDGFSLEAQKKEVVLVYQPYIAEQAIEDTLIVKLLEDNDVFGNIVSPSKFKECYMNLQK